MKKDKSEAVKKEKKEVINLIYDGTHIQFDETMNCHFREILNLLLEIQNFVKQNIEFEVNIEYGSDDEDEDQTNEIKAMESLFDEEGRCIHRVDKRWSYDFRYDSCGRLIFRMVSDIKTNKVETLTTYEYNENSKQTKIICTCMNDPEKSSIMIHRYDEKENIICTELCGMNNEVILQTNYIRNPDGTIHHIYEYDARKGEGSIYKFNKYDDPGQEPSEKHVVYINGLGDSTFKEA